MTIEIVPVEPGHIKAIMAIDAQVYPTPWSRRLWDQELERDHRLYRCAVSDGAVVGVIGVLLAADEAHVMTVAVDPAVQRSGVATALMHAAVGEAIAAGATALTLEVRASNKGAQELYRRFGLAPVGHRRGYYEPDGEDALVMWAHDIDGSDYGTRLEAIAAALAVAA